MSELCVRACEQSGWLGEAVVFLLVAGRAVWNEKQKRDLAAKANTLQSEKAGLQATVQALSQAPSSQLRMGPPPLDLLGLAPAPRPSTAMQTDETMTSDLADRSTDQRK